MSQLRITEIFYSLQGETRTIGIPTVFVRLTGCPLRCGYCDTSYAFQGGSLQSIDSIIEKIQSYNTRYVTITGGEPLAQKNCHILLTKLCDLDYEVSLETSGALDVSNVDKRVIKILDLKTPGSGECDKNLFSNLEYIAPTDQIKFVICNRHDFEWSKAIVDEHQLTTKCHVLFSPSHTEQPAHELADWILNSQLQVRMQIQLHKYLWGDVPGR